MAIYALWDEEMGRLKIGYTARDIALRQAEHERARGKVLRLVGAFPGGRADERRIHARFAGHRIPGTEDFIPHRDIESWLGRPLG